MPGPKKRHIRTMADLLFRMAPIIDVLLLVMIFFVCTRQSSEAYLPHYAFGMRLPDPGVVRRLRRVVDVDHGNVDLHTRLSDLDIPGRVADVDYVNVDVEVLLPNPGASGRVADVYHVIVGVRDDGVLWVHGMPRTEAELTDMLTRLKEIAPQQAVAIAAGPDAQHMYVVRVLNACYRARILDISFAALPEE